MECKMSKHEHVFKSLHLELLDRFHSLSNGVALAYYQMRDGKLRDCEETLEDCFQFVVKHGYFNEKE